jgi:hypothetical protein
MKRVTLLLITVVIVAGAAYGADDKPLAAADLAGIYDLAKFTYKAKDGTPEVVSPPDILLTLELMSSGEFRQTISYKGKSMVNASGTFSVSDSMLVLVNTPTGSRLMGTISDDGRKLLIPIGSGGAAAKYEYIKQ